MQIAIGLALTIPQPVIAAGPPAADIRVTSDGDTRVTSDGDTRVIEA